MNYDSREEREMKTMQQLSKRYQARWWGTAVVLTFAGGGWFWQSQLAAQAPAADPATVKSPAAVEARSHARELSHAFRAASEAILPAVVTIETSSKAKAVRGTGRMPGDENPFKGTPFENYFNEDQLRQFGNQMERPSPRSSGAGSGVIIDPSGVVLTNNHVVSGADVITIRLADGREFKGTDVKTDPQSDLAIVRIENAGQLPSAKLGDSDDMMIGDWVIAVGNPFGLAQTVSAGIISGKGRSIGAAQRTQFLQTDAAINPGNSGGPLVNLDGEVIGINTAIASNGGGNEGIGFAVPANMAKWIAPQLMAEGKVRRAYLGVGIEQLNASLAEKFGVQNGDGVLVTEVFPDTPAAEAGLKEGDVIVDFAGVKVHNPRELQAVVERAPLDSKQTALVLRDGQSMKIDVVAKSLPNEFGRAARPARDEADDRQSSVPSAKSEELGVEVSDLTTAQVRQLGFEGYQGVLVTQVDPDGPAYAAGLREGMLIRKVGRDDVTDAEQFRNLMADHPVKDGVLLLVRT